MRVLVTAGPTREAIDPVRFIANRSSGKMGYAVAAAAVASGHEVRLVSGPVALTPPDGLECAQVTSAAEMLDAVRQWVPWCQVLVMAAAVADWRPAHVSARKLKKATGTTELKLVPTADILSSVRSMKAGRLFVGFAAETEQVVEEASRKLRAKGLDAIVANDVSRPDAGFEVDTNRVVLITAGGAEPWPLMRKTEVARRLVEWIEGAVSREEEGES